MPMKMVFWPALTPEWMAKVRDLGFETEEVDSEEAAVAAVKKADALYGRVTPKVLKAGRKLRWIQASSAGLDRFFFPELRESDVTVTNVRGIYSDVIADHVFAFILSFARNLPFYIRKQLEGKWDKGDRGFIHLAGKTLAILGLGGIGLEVAARGHVVGMRVVAMDPAPKARPEYVERIFEPSELHEMLSEADFVVVCVPHTPETEHLINRAAIKAMKRTAVVVNIGRGKVVYLTALTQALQDGRLGGACLDVFEEEPLPEGHPLWSMENVIITPHLAGDSDEIHERRMTVILENCQRFRDGEPLLNVVDKQKGYVVEPNQ